MKSDTTYYLVDFYNDELVDSIDGIALMTLERYKEFLSTLHETARYMSKGHEFVYYDGSQSEWTFKNYHKFISSFSTREVNPDTAKVLIEYIFRDYNEYEIELLTRGDFPIFQMEDFIEN